MSLERHKQDWERLAEVDAMWAVLTASENKDGGWDADAFYATGEAEIGRVFDALSEIGRPARFEQALDFGCGVGRLTRALGGRFERAIGVDISEAMVSQARSLNAGSPSCEFVVNAAPDLSRFESDSFDFVYSSLVLQHLPSRADIERYVREFLRIVRPDGVAVFGIPRQIAFPYSLQPRRRLYSLLRRLGVSEDFMLRRTPLTPMRMTVVREEAVRALVDSCGGSLLRLEPIDEGPVRATRYYVAPSER